MEDTDDNEHSLGQILESSLVLPSDSNSTFTKQPVNETSRQFLELLGPDSLKTNGEPVYKDYSAPTGSYGKHGEPQSEVNKSFAEPRSGIKLRELLGSEANELSSSHPPRYSREDIVALRDTPAIFQLWNLNYKELIASEFPQLFVGNVIDLANEEEEDNSNFFLRPYQEEIVKRSLAGENDIILLPTGTGKTLVAIKVIIQHIQNRLKNGQKVKVIFFVPRTDLATQQLKQIKKFIPSEWRGKCMKITGDENMSAHMVKFYMRDTENLVIVVTPAIVSNYFKTSREASLSDFSLLVFDEFHHATKKHDYNWLIKRYVQALNGGDPELHDDSLPQMMGMTATIGIGRSKSPDSAREFILSQCAKFNLRAAPSQVSSLDGFLNLPAEEFIVVDKRLDRVSQFIEHNLMSAIEARILSKIENNERLRSSLLGDNKQLEFPETRTNPVYLQMVVATQTALVEISHIPDIQLDTQYCKVALEHLKGYYWCLYLDNLLTCEYAVKYLQQWKHEPHLKGVREIWDMFEGNLETIIQLQEFEDQQNSNVKVERLKMRLEQQLSHQEDSKVIIFVQMRIVAEYLATLLNSMSPKFKANKFISTGRSNWDTSMNAQQRIDIRAKFEGNRYNILVATSVLEEGIDIQACNMVVRYMYVKDMIAKIQSRGRARKVGATLLTILDDKLKEQERTNDVKEKFMYDALQEVRDMSPEVFSKEIYRHSLLMKTSDDEDEPWSTPEDPGEAVRVCCRLCNASLGLLADVRVFMEKHHPVLDASISDRVTVHRKPPKTMYDGITSIGFLLCSNRSQSENKNPCGARVGVLTQLTKEYKFAMWSIRGIVVSSDAFTMQPSEYKSIKERYIIKPLYIEDIDEAGQQFQFRER